MSGLPRPARGNGRTGHEPRIAFVDERLGREAAVRQADYFITCMPCPFIDVLEKVAVNGLEMFGVEVAAWTQARADFTVASRD